MLSIARLSIYRRRFAVINNNTKVDVLRLFRGKHGELDTLRYDFDFDFRVSNSGNDRIHWKVVDTVE
ncbi:hypothetical protein ScPMuIL_016999 [Solemya velum]